MPPSPSEESVPRRDRRLRRGLAVVLSSALALLLVHALLVEVFQVDGLSMDPTLRAQDRVLVLKVVEPRKGQLVVFKHDQGTNVIKRVIAREGERLAIRHGHVFVNGEALDEPYLVHPADQDASVEQPEITIARGQLYVLGDNRIASTDSRRLGPIDARAVVGRAVLAFWPPRWL